MKIQTPIVVNKSDQIHKEDIALKKACKDFESILVSQMLKSMRESVSKTDLFGSSEKEEMFQGMLDNEIAQQMSEKSGFGLGDAIYAQLSRRKTAKG